MTNQQVAAQITVENWNSARELTAGLDGWVFRGQRDTRWGLETSIERQFRNLGRHKDIREELERRERLILEDFQRRAHQFVAERPATVLEWLALIQHHGGPTRLLDFTHSFYVATFFALEYGSLTNPSNVVVWAIEHRRLNAGTSEQFGMSAEHNWRYDEGQYLSRAVKGDLPAVARFAGSGAYRPAAVCIEPRPLNIRLTAQQGTFLAPLEIRIPFINNLAGSFGWDPNQIVSPSPLSSSEQIDDLPRVDASQGWPDTPIVKVILPVRVHLDALRDLRRMNVTAATLFPGLDGLARSQAWHLW